MRHLNDVKFRGYYPHWKDYDDMKSGWIIGLLYYDFSDEEYGIQNEDGIYFVDHKSIGQCTGLKDKNGTEVYEGDIVHARGHDYDFIADVKWDNEKMAYLCNGHYLHEIEEIEIVGNIYENPELLKENG